MIVNRPELPSLVVPVSMNTPPLTPDLPEFAVVTVTRPLLEEAPYPVIK